jgi:hypothetical protein
LKARRFGLVLTVVGLLAATIVLVGIFGGWSRFMRAPDAPETPIAVSASSIDPMNEGRLISVQGKLEFVAAAVDPDLGLAVEDAAILIRNVEMYQWRESCIDLTCTQVARWTDTLVDSSKFHDQIGHVNPDRFPFESAQIDATGIHVGVFRPDSDLLVTQLGKVARPVRLDELPANLSASFSEVDGVLVAGTDPLQPAVGGLRISYSVIPSGTVTLIGIQHADQLVARAKH